MFPCPQSQWHSACHSHTSILRQHILSGSTGADCCEAHRPEFQAQFLLLSLPGWCSKENENHWNPVCGGFYGGHTEEKDDPEWQWPSRMWKNSPGPSCSAEVYFLIWKDPPGWKVSKSLSPQLVQPRLRQFHGLGLLLVPITSHESLLIQSWSIYVKDYNYHDYNILQYDTCHPQK